MNRGSPQSGNPSQLIDARIEELDDWRGAMLAQLRGLIKDADPAVVEEWNEADLCETRKLFNSSLEGNTRRAIDFREGGKVERAAFKALIREAVALNTSARGRRRPRKT